MLRPGGRPHRRRLTGLDAETIWSRHACRRAAAAGRGARGREPLPHGRRALAPGRPGDTGGSARGHGCGPGRAAVAVADLPASGGRPPGTSGRPDAAAWLPAGARVRRGAARTGAAAQRPAARLAPTCAPARRDPPGRRARRLPPAGLARPGWACTRLGHAAVRPALAAQLGHRRPRRPGHTRGRPEQPRQPGRPGEPRQSRQPRQPGQSRQPSWPGEPGQSRQPGRPGEPRQSRQPRWPGEPGGSESEARVRAAQPAARRAGHRRQPLLPVQPPVPQPAAATRCTWRSRTLRKPRRCGAPSASGWARWRRPGAR